MCKDFKGECNTPSCRLPADCRFDPFCKTCRIDWYDNGDGERYRFPKYEVE